LALTLPTSGGRSVGRVRLRTKATKYVCNSKKPEWKGEVGREKNEEDKREERSAGFISYFFFRFK
jgi:hypothetical protein